MCQDIPVEESTEARLERMLDILERLLPKIERLLKHPMLSKFLK